MVTEGLRVGHDRAVRNPPANRGRCREPYWGLATGVTSPALKRVCRASAAFAAGHGADDETATSAHELNRFPRFCDEITHF
jgi:hypothetical protein